MPRAGVGRPFVRASVRRHDFVPLAQPGMFTCRYCPVEMRLAAHPLTPGITRREYRKTAQEKWVTSWPGYCASALSETA